jgi:hypothetical protein
MVMLLLSAGSFGIWIRNLIPLHTDLEEIAIDVEPGMSFLLVGRPVRSLLAQIG